MGKTILDICDSCVSAINKAAWQSCRDGGTDEYNGCGVDVQVSPETTIYVYHDPNKGFANPHTPPTTRHLFLTRLSRLTLKRTLTLKPSGRRRMATTASIAKRHSTQVSAVGRIITTININSF